jgi:hypothetical protein
MEDFWRTKINNQLRVLVTQERALKTASLKFHVRCSASRHEILISGGRLILLSHQDGRVDKRGDEQGGKEAEDILSLLGGSDGKASENDRCRCKEIQFWWRVYTSELHDDCHFARRDYIDEEPWLIHEKNAYTVSEVLSKIPEKARGLAKLSREVRQIRQGHMLNFSTRNHVAGATFQDVYEHGKSVYDPQQKGIPKYAREGDWKVHLAVHRRFRKHSQWERRSAWNELGENWIAKTIGVARGDVRNPWNCPEQIRAFARFARSQEWWKIARSEYGFFPVNFPPKAQWRDEFPGAARGYLRGKGGREMAWATFFRDENGKIQVLVHIQ